MELSGRRDKSTHPDGLVELSGLCTASGMGRWGMKADSDILAAFQIVIEDTMVLVRQVFPSKVNDRHASGPGQPRRSEEARRERRGSELESGLLDE